jgi:hypothetical protein
MMQGFCSSRNQGEREETDADMLTAHDSRIVTLRILKDLSLVAGCNALDSPIQRLRL